MGYNGWQNYSTWAVSLWIDNDEGTYRYFQKLTDREIRESLNYLDLETVDLESVKQDATDDVATAIEEFIDEHNPLGNASVYSDLLSSALSEVDYFEIADHWVSDQFDTIVAELKADAACDNDSV